MQHPNQQHIGASGHTAAHWSSPQANLWTPQGHTSPTILLDNNNPIPPQLVIIQQQPPLAPFPLMLPPPISQQQTTAPAHYHGFFVPLPSFGPALGLFQGPQSTAPPATTTQLASSNMRFVVTHEQQQQQQQQAQSTPLERVPVAMPSRSTPLLLPASLQDASAKCDARSKTDKMAPPPALQGWLPSSPPRQPRGDGEKASSSSGEGDHGSHRVLPHPVTLSPDHSAASTSAAKLSTETTQSSASVFTPNSLLSKANTMTAMDRNPLLEGTSLAFRDSPSLGPAAHTSSSSSGDELSSASVTEGSFGPNRTSLCRHYVMGRCGRRKCRFSHTFDGDASHVNSSAQN